MALAWACRMTEGNFSVIASEKPDFNLKEAQEWLSTHKSGYFLRDEHSAFDCKYLQEDVFFNLYMFTHGDVDSLFRQVLRL